MKHRIFFCCIIISGLITKIKAQDFISDSIRAAYTSAKTDSLKIKTLLDFAEYRQWSFKHRDSATILLEKALAITKQKGLVKQELEIIVELCNTYIRLDYNLQKGYQLAQNGINLSRKYQLKAYEADLLIVLSYLVNNKDSIKLLVGEASIISLKNKNILQQVGVSERLAQFYCGTHNDSTRFYLNKGFFLASQSNSPKIKFDLYVRTAFIFSQYLNADSASYYLSQAAKVARDNNFIDKELRLLTGLVSSEGGFFDRESFEKNYQRMLILCRQFKRDSLGVMSVFAQSARDIGSYTKSLQVYTLALRANELLKDSVAIENNLYGIALCYQSMTDYKKSNEYLYEAKKYGNKNAFINIFIHDDLAKNYLNLKQNDSSLSYVKKTYQLATTFYGSEAQIYGGVLNDLGSIYLALNIDSLAIDHLRRSYIYFIKNGIQYFNFCFTTKEMAKYFNKKGLMDSCVKYARICFNIARSQGFLNELSASSELIATYFQRKQNIDSAFYYQQIGFQTFKKLYNNESSREFQNLAIAEQQRKEEIEKEKEIYKNKIRTNILIGSLFTLAIIIFFLYRNNLQKQKAKFKIEEAYNQLKSTQQQLVQSEKMASLGELTAGIAHEIQNPLNFVNNFSELNVELTSELKDMVRSLDHASAERSRSDAGLEMTALIDDISTNSEKINHHGQRAAAIVKGMLQHSRSSNGTKEPTDINALCDEYLRLAYHGLRAKDKDFNAEFKTEFDPNVGKLNVIPQDIGRVILNLINNAFYAVHEKQKKEENYEPTVIVSTKKLGDKVEIRVADNGGGIPETIKEKIFQPFFTTKPTGQGTGLGLSLAYDIVTKVHGGKLTVESELGKGTIFKIEIST